MNTHIPVKQTTILLIDDDHKAHELIDFHLEGLSDKILHAYAPDGGFELAVAELPDVILLDVGLPKIDGFELCRNFKSNELTRDIPILFLTGDSSVYHIAKGLDVGAIDYITKPFEVVELQARVRVALRHKRMLDLLKDHARIDGLTELANRDAFNESLAAAILDRDRPFSLLMLDLDHFKEVNDSLGHQKGDDILRAVGHVLRKNCHSDDRPCRYSEGTFAIILRHVELDNSQDQAEQIRQAIAEIKLQMRNEPLTLTCSAGLVRISGQTSDIDTATVIYETEQALDQAKNNGRNQLVIKDLV